MQAIAAAGEPAWRLWCALHQRAPPALLVALLRRLDEQGLLSVDAGQAALLSLLQPAAPLLPPDAEHRRRLLRAVVLAAEADGQEVDEQLMQLYSNCLLGQQLHCTDSHASGDSNASGSLLPPPPPPDWCYKLWSYAPAGEAPAALLAAAAALQRAAAERQQVWLESHQNDDRGQQQQAGTLPPCPPAAVGDGSRGLLALHVSLNLLEGGTGCHEWEAGFYLAEWVLNNGALIAGRTCLEIGCGAGMVGVAAHRAGAAHMLCTDGDPQTVANCRLNLQLNDVPLAELSSSRQTASGGSSSSDGSSSGSSSSGGTEQPRQATAECIQLCWEDGWPPGGVAGEGQQQAPTVVLGADLLYDPTVIPTLLSLFKQVLGAAATHEQQDQQQQPAVYLATTLRNEATLHQFLAAVEADAAICMEQLAGPPVPGTSGRSSSSGAAPPPSSSDAQEPSASGAPAGPAAVAATAAQEPAGGSGICWQHVAATAAQEPAGGSGICWQHVAELDAARERIFLHRITLAP